MNCRHGKHTTHLYAPWQAAALLLFLFALSCGLSPVRAAPLSMPPPTGVQGVEPEKKPEKKEPSLTELISKSTTLPKRLIDLHNDIQDLVKVKQLQEQVPQTAKELDTLSWAITMAKSDPNLRFDKLASLDSTLHKLKNKLNRMMSPVTDSIDQLAGWNRQWSTARERLDQWKKKIQQDPTLTLATDHLQTIGQTIDTALQLIEDRLKPTLEIAGKISELQIRLYSMNVDLQELIEEFRATGIEQTSPSMFSSAFYRQINRPLWEDTWHNIVSLLRQQKKNLATHGWNVAIGILSVLLLIASVSYSQRLTIPSARWYPFTRRPVATALFILLSLLELFLLFFNRQLPPGWSIFLQIIVVLSVIRLTGILISDRWAKRFLRQLLAFLALTLLLKLIRLPHPLVQLYIFYVSVLGVVYLFWKSFQQKKRKKATSTAWVLRLNALLPAGILVAEISGYDEVAQYVFSSFLLTVVAILVLWMLFIISTGTTELILYRAPIPLLRRNASAIVRQLIPLFALFFSCLLLIVALVIWRVYPSTSAAFQGLKAIGFSAGSIRITLSLVLSVVGVLYGALLTSRWLQALLRQEILPRYHADIGVQLSITRLVHYAVLLIGFLILLRVLGFELTKLTILGGALGVGIGFGLQAIVNNFASGLILLFERPIKVGDMIQVGPDLGEVKKLGLRATVVQTLDNAEIVVPNSDLITGQVTNWTLAERRIRVKVPVGVAYGTDIAKVLEILLACAEANPLVLTQPKARALFLAFGASSLDFELRVWISDFANRRQVLSELNQDIESEFRSAGIEIPFPQQDIHLRSVDEPVQEVLLAGRQGKGTPVREG